MNYVLSIGDRARYQAVRYVAVTWCHTPHTGCVLTPTAARKNRDKTFPCGAGAIQIAKPLCYLFQLINLLLLTILKGQETHCRTSLARS